MLSSTEPLSIQPDGQDFWITAAGATLSPSDDPSMLHAQLSTPLSFSGTTRVVYSARFAAPAQLVEGVTVSETTIIYGILSSEQPGHVELTLDLGAPDWTFAAAHGEGWGDLTVQLQAPCSSLQVPGWSAPYQAAVAHPDEGSGRVLRGAVGLSPSAGGPPVAILQPQSSRAELWVVEEQGEHARISMRWEDGTVLDGWIQSEGLEPSYPVGALGLLGGLMGGLMGEPLPDGPLLPEEPGVRELVRLPAGTFLAAEPGAAGWATLSEDTDATVLLHSAHPEWAAVVVLDRAGGPELGLPRLDPSLSSYALDATSLEATPRAVSAAAHPEQECSGHRGDAI